VSYEPAYLRYQYSDPEKLRIRAATHRDFTEPRGDGDPFVSALLEPCGSRLARYCLTSIAANFFVGSM